MEDNMQFAQIFFTKIGKYLYYKFNGRNFVKLNQE